MAFPVETLLRRERAVLLGVIGVLFLLAALYTALGAGMPMPTPRMDMPNGVQAAADRWSASFALLVFLMWWVMMVAMMLPGITPLILLYAALLHHSEGGRRAPAKVGLVLVGYFVIWAGFSGVATLAQWWLDTKGLVAAGTMALTGSLPGAAVLIAAGAFQFTPMKAACLGRCRGPAEFIADHHRPGLSGGFRMGFSHGIFCLGCCWFLMALLFVGGIMNLYWIVGLAAFVTVEKLTPFGEVLGRFAGAGLVGWGAYIAVASL